MKRDRGVLLSCNAATLHREVKPQALYSGRSLHVLVADIQKQGNASNPVESFSANVILASSRSKA